MAREQRRLAAIVAADVVGYSRLMGRDEGGTVARLREHRKQRFEPTLARHGGRLVKLTGDGALAEFPSAVDALGAAIEFQQAMEEANRNQPEDKRIVFRVGLHLGDLIVDGDDLYGDGVNVAARLEAGAPAGGIVISRNVHDAVARRIKATFDDLGGLALKNIDRPVQAFSVKWNAADWKVSGLPAVAPSVMAPAADVPLTLPDKPSIAVLPFQNMSGDAEQEYFADGMVEEIITALSRFKSLFVIARNSTFTYKGKAVDVKLVGRELGVRYVLEGSVRKGGNRLRITGQLIDCQTGAHLWADRFDGALEDVFELQDNVASSVAGVIEPALLGAEMGRSAQRPTSDLTAYDFYLRALTAMRTGEVDRESFVKALDLLSQAIQRDARYAPALAMAGSCRSSLDVAGWIDDAGANRDEALRLTRRALAIAPDDSNVLAYGAYVMAYFGEDIVTAIALIDRALELNPSFAIGWWRSGWLRLWAGQPDLAIEHFETGLRLSPRVRVHDPFLGIGVGHFFARRFHEAREMLLRSIQENPNWVPSYRFLASCYAQMGRRGEARETIERLRSLTDVVVPHATHWRNPEHRQLYLEGLRLATEG
jgi:TolB-like protein/class 3 adenylate cyclase/Tfp pilus assembly protein PilF